MKASTFVIAACLIAAPVLAQTTSTYRLCSAIHGHRITSSSGEEIGTVEDVVFDPAEGRIVTVVLSVENRLVPVPWNVISVNEERNVVVVNVERDVLVRAPVIERTQINRIDSQFIQRSTTYFSSASKGRENVRQEGSVETRGKVEMRRDNQTGTGSEGTRPSRTTEKSTDQNIEPDSGAIPNQKRRGNATPAQRRTGDQNLERKGSKTESTGGTSKKVDESSTTDEKGKSRATPSNKGSSDKPAKDDRKGSAGKSEESRATKPVDGTSSEEKPRARSNPTKSPAAVEAPEERKEKGQSESSTDGAQGSEKKRMNKTKSEEPAKGSKKGTPGSEKSDANSPANSRASGGAQPETARPPQ